ncbi:MAG: diguanylate cyclase [Herbaspirillum sp.]|nr:diguanylate cyclase [Herbaspirillum sp.]
MRSDESSISPFSKHRVTAVATLFVSVVCLLLVALTAWSAWNARVVQLRELDTATENMSRSMAQHADDTFKAADTALVGVAEHIANDGVSPKSIERMKRLLMLWVQELPALQSLLIIDNNGRLVASSRGAINPSLDYSDREFFIYHRGHPDAGPKINFPVISRTNGSSLIPMTRRLNDANGKFSGVAVASVRTDYFYNFYASYAIGHDGVIFLALNSGIQLVRWPARANAIGKNLTGPLFSQNAGLNDSGNAMIISPTDQIERLIGYHHLNHYPMVAVAGLSKYEILAVWRQETMLHGVIVMVIISGLGFIGFRLIEQINLRVHAEEEAHQAGEALKELNQTLEKLAMQDGLTGLANRRLFDIELQNELSRATRSASSLALIMIDVDFFKKYNDLYGHLAGDECLRQVGKILKSAEGRLGDLAARYGGEEFALLLPSTDVQGAVQVAEKICKAIRELEIRHDGNSAADIVTISAGVNALMPVTEGDTPAMMIGAADEALYVAKASGRNQTRAYRGIALATG